MEQQKMQWELEYLIIQRIRQEVIVQLAMEKLEELRTAVGNLELAISKKKDVLLPIETALLPTL
jgi:hypothetical protein